MANVDNVQHRKEFSVLTADVESVAVQCLDAAYKFFMYFFGMGVNGVWQHVVSSF